ncbi:MAG: hypothetical protein ACO1RX_13510 [Candidatus Sericytochromatia bacterium]
MSISAPVSAICYGPMKSGKSRYLVALARQFQEQGKSFLAFKPLQDTRDGCWIRSRDPECVDVQALGVSRCRELISLIGQAVQHPAAFAARLPAAGTHGLSLRESFYTDRPLTACLIDEVFLLDSDILELMSQLQAQGISLYLSGLDRDFRGQYFPLRAGSCAGVTMKQVIERCDQILPLTARCESCQGPATLTQRLIGGAPAPYDSPTVLIGDEEYQPRCLDHHVVTGRPQLASA